MKAELATLRPPRIPRALWRRTVNLHASPVIQVTAPALPAPPRQPLAAAAAEMVLASLKQRWQKEAVKKADLVGAVQGSWAPGWVLGGGAAAGGGARAGECCLLESAGSAAQIGQRKSLCQEPTGCSHRQALLQRDLAAGCHCPILTARPALIRPPSGPVLCPLAATTEGRGLLCGRHRAVP